MADEPPSDSPRCPQCRGRDGKHKMGCRAPRNEPPFISEKSQGNPEVGDIQPGDARLQPARADEPPLICTCDYECDGRYDDTDCPEHGRRDEPLTDSLPVCPGCGAVAERIATPGGTHLESAHRRDCPWMADPESEPYG